MRFRDYVSKVCYNRKANFSDLSVGINFVKQLNFYLNQDRVAVLNLSKNHLSDQGVKVLMESVRNSRSIISLNLSSCDI